MKFKTFKEMYDYLIKHKDEIYPKNSEAFMDDSFEKWLCEQNNKNIKEDKQL